VQLWNAHTCAGCCGSAQATDCLCPSFASGCVRGCVWLVLLLAAAAAGACCVVPSGWSRAGICRGTSPTGCWQVVCSVCAWRSRQQRSLQAGQERLVASCLQQHAGLGHTCATASLALTGQGSLLVRAVSPLNLKTTKVCSGILQWRALLVHLEPQACLCPPANGFIL
jgi:hypothetical protein